MKRIFALLISVVLLMTSYAFAEQPVFLLKNGLQWGLTENDIYGLLGEEVAWSDTLFDGVDMMQYILDTDIDSGTVSLSMVLVDGELALIMYDLLGVDDPVLKAGIISEFTAAYGEPVDGGMDRYIASLCLLSGEPLTAEDIGAPGTGCSWELADGTYMGVYDMSDISFSVCFVNEPRFAIVGEYEAAVPSVSLDSELIYDADNGSSIPAFPDFLGLLPDVWPMNREEVIAAAELNGYVEYKYSENTDSVYCEFIDDSGMFSVDYLFGNDGTLLTQKYSYMSFNGESATDPLAEISAIYGEPVSTDADTLCAILIETGLGQFASTNEMLSYGLHGDVSWYPADGSFIFLLADSGNFNLFAVRPDVVSAVQ